MQVSQVLAKSDELIGQSVQVEGTLLKYWRSIWYIASPESASPDKLEGEYIRLHSSEGYDVLSEQYNALEVEADWIRELDSIFQEFGHGKASKMSSQEAKEHYRSFRKTRDQKHLDVFVQADLEEYIPRLFPFVNTSKKMTTRLTTAASRLSFGIGDPEYRYLHPGQVTGTLLHSEDDPSELILDIITDIVSQYRDYTCSITRARMRLEDVEMGMQHITSAMSVIDDLAKFVGHTIRLKGAIVGGELLSIVPYFCYAETDSYQSSAIALDSPTVIRMIKENIEGLFGDPVYEMEAHIVGKIVIDENGPFPAKITLVQKLATMDRYGSIYEWNL